MPKQAKLKGDCVINPQNYNSNQFLYVKFWCSQNDTSQPKSSVEFGYIWINEDESNFNVKMKYFVAFPIEDRERNLTKSILARVCTLNVCGYSTLLRSVQWKVHKNTLLKQDIFLLWGGTNLHECLEWTEICP